MTWCVWPSNDFTNLPAGQLEHLHELVRAAGGEQLAVRAERDPEHGVAVARLDLDEQLAGVASKILISPSSVGAPPPVANFLPSRGERDGAHAVREPARCRFFGSPFSTSQIVSSWKLPVASVLPSGLNAIDSTSEMWAAFAALPSGVFSCGSKSDFANAQSCLSCRPSCRRDRLQLEEVNLVAAAGGDGLAVRRDRDRPHRLDQRRRQVRRRSSSFTCIWSAAFAPSSIHSLMSVTSFGLSGSSVLGGMIGFFCRLQNRNR